MSRGEWIQQVAQTVTGWEGVSAAPHRFGGTEFNVGKVEIGHIHHGNGMVDIPYTRKLREQLVAENKTGLHHLLQDSGWTTTFIREATDVERVIWLFRLSYLQKVARRKQIDLAGELAALDASAPLRALLGADGAE